MPRKWHPEVRPQGFDRVWKRRKIQTVIIDSPKRLSECHASEQFLILHLHELLQYLNRQGAATFLTVAPARDESAT